MISTSRNKAQKIVIFVSLAFLATFLKNFALKTCGTLKIFLLRTQNNFYIIFSWYVEEYVKKNWSLNFMSLVGFQACKFWKFFWKICCGASLEIIFKQKYFPKALCFFYFLTGLEESIELWILISWVLG